MKCIKYNGFPISLFIYQYIYYNKVNILICMHKCFVVLFNFSSLSIKPTKKINSRKQMKISNIFDPTLNSNSSIFFPSKCAKIKNNFLPSNYFNITFHPLNRVSKKVLFLKKVYLGVFSKRMYLFCNPH